MVKRLFNRGGRIIKHYYTEKQLKEFYGDVTNKERIVIGYCRVSSAKQKEALERQIENVRTYLISKGYQFKIITDIGSGINYDKKTKEHSCKIERFERVLQ